MKHYLLPDGKILDIFKDGSQDHLITDEMILVSDEVVEELRKPTPEQLAQQAKSAVYALLDTTAQQYDYRNMAEVAQFVQSGTWKAEADALLAWQDAVWLKAYALLKEPITSVDDFVAQLPKYGT